MQRKCSFRFVSHR